MRTQQPFKSYQRGQRIQDSSTSFSGGMHYTDSPLEDGQSRLLVNYDLDEETLVPRRGITTTAEGLLEYSGLALDFLGPTALQDGMSIVAGNKVTINNVEYKQIIVGQIIKEAPGETAERKVGNAWVLTCKGSKIQYEQLNNSTQQAPGGPHYCYFVTPEIENAEIHGVRLRDSEYLKRHIGVFAYNGNYYYFTSDGSLRRTYFDATPGVERFKSAIVTPFEPYISEVRNSLYNMLLADPYTYKNEPNNIDLAMPEGVQTYSKNRNITPVSREVKVNPVVGEAYDYKLYYLYTGEPVTDEENATPAQKIHIAVSYFSPAEGVEHRISRDETELFIADGRDIYIDDIQINVENAVLRVYFVTEADAVFTSGKQLEAVSLVKAAYGEFSIIYQSKSADSTKNLQPVNYDLSKASGMVFWKNRVFLYGAQDTSTGLQDNTILFASGVNRPDWFDYPASADIFDEEIIYLQPMLDELLVFTAGNLYSLTLSVDGLSWTKRHLQSNLNIKPWDLNLIQVVKNMVFFKSGNYYYMVVPKITNSQQGLAIAPISKPITGFLDDFGNQVHKILDEVYNFSLYSRHRERAKTTFTYKPDADYDTQLVHYYNYLDYEDVHCTYLFKIKQRTKVSFDASEGGVGYVYEDSPEVLMNFSILYNTVTRTWRIHISESERMLHPLFMNATGKGVYGTLVNYKDKACVQFLEYSSSLHYDLYVKQESSDAPSRSLVLRNWQYLDTGNLEQNSDMKKRYREYQFKISNTSRAALEFYTGFFVDTLARTYEMQYTEEEIEDGDENLSTLVVDATPAHNVQGEFVINDWTTLGAWVLGRSQFPNVRTWKVRIPTSGKGYLPRTILISYNENGYELLSHSTVYRQLYSR